MARSGAKPIRPVGCRGDERGQMMVLSAVLLVISFVALAAMVGRVNQLGSQTASESRKVILDEVGPLADSLNAAIQTFGGQRIVTGVTWTSGETLLTGPSGSFNLHDVGRRVFVDSNSLVAGTTVTAYLSSTQIRVSNALPGTNANSLPAPGLYIDQFRATVSAAGVVTSTRPFFTDADEGLSLTGHANLRAGTRITDRLTSTTAQIGPVPLGLIGSTTTFAIGDFALSSTSTPPIETAVRGMLEQMQNLLATRGLWMDYQMPCGGGGTTVENSYALIRLFDGQVWLEVSSTATFTRTTACNLDPTVPGDGISG